MRGYRFLRITAWLLTIASGLDFLMEMISEWPDFIDYPMYLNRRTDL